MKIIPAINGLRKLSLCRAQCQCWVQTSLLRILSAWVCLRCDSLMGIRVRILHYSCRVFSPCVQSAAHNFSLLLLYSLTYVIEEPCSGVWLPSSGTGRFDTSKSSQNVDCGLETVCLSSFFSVEVENCFILFSLRSLEFYSKRSNKCDELYHLFFYSFLKCEKNYFYHAPRSPKEEQL